MHRESIQRYCILKFSGKMDGLTEGLWQEGQRNTLKMLFQCCRRCSQRLRLAPAVTESRILARLPKRFYKSGIFIRRAHINQSRGQRI
jgi:hypothetical protein